MASVVEVGVRALRVLALCEATEELAASAEYWTREAVERRAMLTAAEGATRAARELAELVGAINPLAPGQLELMPGSGIYLSYLSPGELRAQGAAMAPAVLERWRATHGAEDGAL